MNPGPTSQRNGAAQAAFICLLIAFLVSMIPLIGWVFGGVFALVAFILGIVACAQSRVTEGITAIAGSLFVVPVGGVVGWIAIAILALGTHPTPQKTAAGPLAPAPITPSSEFKMDAPSAPSVSFSGLRGRAENGDAQAQYQVGLCYYLGQNVPVDYDEAVRWFKRAADQGNKSAEMALSRFIK